MTDATQSGSDGLDGVDDLVGAVLTASRVLVGVSARSLDAVGHAVTVTQFRTLVVLEGRGGTNLNGLAERLGVNASTALRMVDKLVTAGLVSRRDNPDNRREVQLGLTDAGASAVRKVTRRRRHEISKIVSAMPVDRRSELVEALTAFAHAAGEPAAVDEAAPFGW